MKIARTFSSLVILMRVNPEIRKFNGNMSNLCRHGGGSLRGQRGDDCGVDLGLKECIRHPKKKMGMWPGVGVGVGVGVAVAGVKLNNNTGLTTQSERRLGCTRK